MIEATPRPWVVIQNDYAIPCIVGADGEYVIEEVANNADKNAEFIVKAVNSHDALVAALKETNEALMFSAVVKTPQGKDGLQKKMWKLRKDIVHILEQVK